MYPNQIHLHYYPYNSSSEETYLYSTPYQGESYYNGYYEVPDGRQQFGGQFTFPPFGQGPMTGPPTLPPFGQGPMTGLPTSPPFGQGPITGLPTSPPFGQGQMAGPPTSAPPSIVPTQQVEAFAVDPGGIRRCLFRFTYVWLRGFEQFWFYPIFVGRNSVAGYRWTGRRWIYFGIDLRQIQSFTCF